MPETNDVGQHGKFAKALQLIDSDEKLIVFVVFSMTFVFTTGEIALYCQLPKDVVVYTFILVICVFGIITSAVVMKLFDNLDKKMKEKALEDKRQKKHELDIKQHELDVKRLECDTTITLVEYQTANESATHTAEKAVSESDLGDDDE